MLPLGTPGRLLRLPHGDAVLPWLLGSLSAVMFVLGPLREVGWLPRGADQLALTAVAIAGLLSLRRPTVLLWPLVLSVLLLIVAQGAVLHPDSGKALVTVAALATVLSLVLLAVALTAQVLAPGRITSARIQGAVALYLLLVLIFAAAYHAVELLAPGSFDPPGMGLHDARLLYFSMVTQTTTGYGDIAPLHPVARSLAMLQGLTGQMFIAVLLARLVSLELASRLSPHGHGGGTGGEEDHR
jgi:hypothetical protein